MKSKLVFGIDEAGRGPLAGPVAVAVFGKKLGYKIKNFPKGKDSKKMTEKERELWFEVLRREKEKGNLYFEFAFVSAISIDKYGIVFSIKKAMKKCMDNLEKKGILKSNSKILLDGSLKAPEKYKNQKTIIKGDEKEMVISCASIIVKVNRDRLMKKLSKKYPLYGFEKHKGYGTFDHRRMILKHGLVSLHRKSFIKATTRTMLPRPGR